MAACQPSSEGRAVFERDVVPVLERHCSSEVCHGVTEAGEAAGEVIDWDRLFLRVDEVGAITDVDAAYETAKRAIDTVEEPGFSSLLRKPLARVYGGLAHHGGENFRTPRDLDYRSIRDWIAIETGGGEDPEPLTELEERFERDIQPFLVGAACMSSNCHGSDGAVPLRFDPGVDGAFPIAATRANYEAARTMLSLDGDAGQSRLLVKTLGLHQGGIVHKGGNAAFMTSADDPRARAISSWACEERRELTGADCGDPGEPPIDGFVFVRGPISPGSTFDLDQFTPGRDLYFARVGDPFLVPEEVTNLTGELHAAPADVRDPAVRPDGQRVVFAMRGTADRGHALYELELGDGTWTRLTEPGRTMSGGGLWTDRDPTYGPDGHIWFVSTRAGAVADRGTLMDADLYELDPQTGAVVRRTFTPHVERKPVYFTTGEEAGGEIGFSALRDAVGGSARAHPFRFPPGLGTEYHQHFGITPIEDLFFDARELADGRYVVTIGDLSGRWQAGRLGVVDRNFGPEINEAAPESSPAIPGYEPPLARLDPDAAAVGVTAGMYRDPVGIPDGRVLVAYAPGPFDLEDDAVVPDFRIEAIELAEALDRTGPEISGREVLVDEPLISDFDPEPVFVRAMLPRTPEPAWDPEQADGYFHHLGVPVIDALLSNLFPSGKKALREDLVYVRLVQALPRTPNERHPVPANETLGGELGATASALGEHGPARVLAELPLAPDGSFHARIPAGVAFRLQGLDARRMAVGAMHNRWYYLAPGQTIRQGLADPERFYASRCGACHGALDGVPEHALQSPDVMTMASVTDARFEHRDPRRPTAPPQLGAGTAIEVDFSRDIRPILDRSCAIAGCHDAQQAAAGLVLDATPTLHFDVGYEQLLATGAGSGGGRAYVDDAVGSARRSYLMEKLLGVELEAPRDLASPGVPHPGPGDGVVALEEEELLTIIRWIDLGATWSGGAP